MYLYIGRKTFVKENFHAASLLHVRLRVHRSDLYDDLIKLYSTKPKLVNQFPFRISFVGEGAVDFGRVSRDCFSGFWEQAY